MTKSLTLGASCADTLGIKARQQNYTTFDAWAGSGTMPQSSRYAQNTTEAIRVSTVWAEKVLPVTMDYLKKTF